VVKAAAGADGDGGSPSDCGSANAQGASSRSSTAKTVGVKPRLIQHAWRGWGRRREGRRQRWRDRDGEKTCSLIKDLCHAGPAIRVANLPAHCLAKQHPTHAHVANLAACPPPALGP